MNRLLVNEPAPVITAIRPGGLSCSDASPEAHVAVVQVQRLAAMQAVRHQGGVATKSLNSGVPV